MKITIFTSNQPRHLSLVSRLAEVADEVYAVQEVNTLYPGIVKDFFQKSEVMAEYFSNVLAAEQTVFGDVKFTDPNVRQLAVKMGDLSFMTEEQLTEALNADVFVVFGASYIKGWLATFLVDQKAINIHMGLSPYYRGSSCNFWALFDNNPNHVGATIHRLSTGLDSGEILFHCLPLPREKELPFEFTMRSVMAAHVGLAKKISSGEIWDISPVPQDKQRLIRYSKNADFTDEVASEFLGREFDLRHSNCPDPDLISPFLF